MTNPIAVEVRPRAAVHLKDARDCLGAGGIEEQVGGHLIAAHLANPNEVALLQTTDRVVGDLKQSVARFKRVQDWGAVIRLLAITYAVKPDIATLQDLMQVLHTIDQKPALAAVAELMMTLVPQNSPEAAQARFTLFTTEGETTEAAEVPAAPSPV